MDKCGKNSFRSPDRIESCWLLPAITHSLPTISQKRRETPSSKNPQGCFVEKFLSYGGSRLLFLFGRQRRRRHGPSSLSYLCEYTLPVLLLPNCPSWSVVVVTRSCGGGMFVRRDGFPYTLRSWLRIFNFWTIANLFSFSALTPLMFVWS